MTKEYILDYEDSACECLPEDHSVIIRQNGQHLSVFCGECGERVDIVEIESEG